MRTVLLALLIAISFTQCDPPPTEQQPDDVAEVKSGPKNGEWITKRKNGTIKTRVNYQDGVKHGTSYLYYEDGTSLQLEIPYVVGARHGISKKYFRNGQLYAETPYQADKLHGTRTTYYRNGGIKSQLTYFEGFIGNDLIENYKSGKSKELPKIKYTRNGNEIVLSLTKDCKAPIFYIGELTNGSFFNERGDVEMLPRIDGKFIIDLNTYTPSYLAVQDIICHCKTSQGNPRVTTTRIKLN